MAVVQASPTESASEPVQKSETEPEDLPSPCISLYSEDEEPMCAGTAMTHASTVQSYLLAEQPVVDVLSPEQKLCQALDNLVEVAGIVLGDVTPTPLASPSTIDRREDETDAVSALLALSAGTPAPHEQPHVPAPVTPVDVPSFSVSERPRPVAMDVEERAVSDVVVDVDIGCVPAEVAALDDGMDSSADIKDVVPPPADRHQGFLPDNVGHFVTPAVSSDLDAMSSEEMADQISETLAQMAAVPTSFSDMSDALMAELEVLIGTELNTMDVQVEAPPIGQFLLLTSCLGYILMIAVGGGDTLMGFAQALSPVMEELEGESIPESIAVDSASSLHLVSPPDVAQPCDEDQELDEASALDACSSSEDTLRYDFPSPASPSPTLEAPSMASSSGGVHAAGPAEEPADSSLRSPDSTDSLASPRAVPSPERASNVEEPLVLAASPPHEPCSSEDRAEEAEVEELLISSEIRPVSETPSHNARDDKPDASPEATEVLQASEEKETEGPATPSQLPTKLVSPPVAANERLAEDAKDERQVEGDRELVSGSGEVEAEVKHDGKAPVQESNSQSSPSQSSPSPRPASSPRRSRFRSLSPTAQEALRSYILGETPPTPLEQLTPYSKLSRPVRLCKTRDYRRKQLSSLGRPLPEAILLDAISNARSAEPSSSEVCRTKHARHDPLLTRLDPCSLTIVLCGTCHNGSCPE
ncbi:hypothetical protein BV20DRAFT_774378 [Pilatotrama ljubarskyi]|nr:hypothetical protein BV20DRAFT_774378 [Pilatotrama ljubarskyi]